MPQLERKIAHRNLLSIYKESLWRFNKTELYFDANKLRFFKKTQACVQICTLKGQLGALKAASSERSWDSLK